MAHSPLRIAHRGMPRHMHENTLPSFAAALSAGADGIELDVHATADDVVVVHHDSTLRGREIHRTAWALLRDVEIAPGTRVPTLEEVCRLIDGAADLFVEIKGAGIEEQVLEVLQRHGDGAAIHSFDHAMIARIAQRGAPYRLGILFEDDAERAVSNMREVGATDLWPHHSLVTERLVREVHDSAGRVMPWTVNDPAEARRLIQLGVDGLCTDDVTLLDAL